MSTIAFSLNKLLYSQYGLAMLRCYFKICSQKLHIEVLCIIWPLVCIDWFTIIVEYVIVSLLFINWNKLHNFIIYHANSGNENILTINVHVDI